MSCCCSSLALCSLLLPLLMVVVVVVVVESAEVLPAPEFAIPPDSHFSKGKLYYRTLLVDPLSNVLYVGAMNTLYKLDADNVNRTHSAKHGELELKPTTEALASCSGRTRDQELKCQNHVKVMLPRGDGNLFLCTTNAMSPMLSIIDSHGEKVLKSGTSGAAICPSDPDDVGTAVWVEHGNPGNIASPYSATVTDYTGTNRVIYRPPLINERGEMHVSYMSTIYTDSKWLKEPTFVASFDPGDGYVYFFFREYGIEYSSCDDSIYSRVARVCKSDLGGRNLLKQTWTTFLKARLNCSLFGDFPFHFNAIQDVQMVKDDKYGALFYATFTTSTSGPSASAICVYSLNDVKLTFERGTFKSQPSSAHAWLPLPIDETPLPRPGQCVADSKMLSDTSLHFIKSHSLLHDCVPPVPSCSNGHSGLVFYAKDVSLSKLVVDRMSTEGKSVFVVHSTSDTGRLYSIAVSRMEEEEDQRLVGNLVSTFRLASMEPVRALALLPGKYLYIAQDDGVAQMKVVKCALYQTCLSCAQSPYCAWDGILQQCLDGASSQREGQSSRVRFNANDPKKPLCTSATRRFTKLLYPGDSYTMSCHQRELNADTVWLFNNERVNFNDGKHFLTVDNTLVVVNITKTMAGHYDCVQQRSKLVSYQVLVDDVSCHKPQTLQAFRSVYQEWCREFQEYKMTMVRWKRWYEQNLQCSSSSPLDRRKFNTIMENEYKSNRLSVEIYEHYAKETKEAAEKIRNVLCLKNEHPFCGKFSKQHVYNMEEDPLEECLVLHVLTIQALQNDLWCKAFVLQMQAVRLFMQKVVEVRRQENWFLPILYQLCSNLRRVATIVDKRASNAFPSEEGTCLEQAAGQIMACYRICVSDHHVAPELSKRVGVLNLTNTLFRIHYASNKWDIINPLLRTIDSAESLSHFFSLADKVAYKYFLGRKAMYDSDFELADNYLSFAFKMCPAKYGKNRRVILVHLIPVKIFRGQMPSKALLETYHLTDYEPLVKAVKLGSASMLDRVIRMEGGLFATFGFSMFLLKLKMVCHRNLIKQVCNIVGIYQIPLKYFLIAFQILGCKKDFTIDNVECLLANLIYAGQVKGYIAHKNQKLVISKKNAFPRLSGTNWKF